MCMQMIIVAHSFRWIIIVYFTYIARNMINVLNASNLNAITGNFSKSYPVY